MDSSFLLEETLRALFARARHARWWMGFWIAVAIGALFTFAGLHLVRGHERSPFGLTTRICLGTSLTAGLLALHARARARGAIEQARDILHATDPSSRPEAT